MVEGTYPLPDWPAGAELVLVLDPPPLDLPLVAGEWPPGRRLVLAPPRGGQGTGLEAPLRDLLGVPRETLEAALDWLKGQPSPVLFLSFDRHPWYSWLVPQDLRDRYRVPGRRHDGYFYGYHPHHRAYLFDDGYRRQDLGVLRFAQSSAYFLRVLEELPYTADPPVKKRIIFRDLFPFYNAGINVAPETRFAWHCDDAGCDLATLRQSAVGPDLAEHSTEYALAICALSEIAACFTHSGQGQLYGTLMGDLARLDGPTVQLAPGLTDEQQQRLRQAQPDLYLHLRYRVPNQCLVAGFDALGWSDPALLAAGEALLIQLQGEALPLAKRDHELTALAGTLCQFHTFAGRHLGQRPHLKQARECGRLALERARPFEYGRDLNYWAQAVLSDWALFPDQARAEPGLAADREALVAGLSHHLDEDPDNPYNLMLLFLAAAVEQEVLGSARVRDLLTARQVGPGQLAQRFTRDDYDQTQAGHYALALAAGYAALDAATPDQDRPALNQALAAAREFFLRAHPDGILGVVGLKFAVCDLYRLGADGQPQARDEAGADWRRHARSLDPDRVPARVLDLIAHVAGGGPLTRGEALGAVFSMPY